MKAKAKFNVVIALLCIVALMGGGAQRVWAQEAPAIPLDEAGFGVVKADALEPQAKASYTLELKAGDRVAMDLEGETDALQVSAFEAPWGDLELESIPFLFNYSAWAPEDGAYTVVVENTGDKAAGFTLRVVVSPAPLPTKKVLNEEADGQNIPVMVGEKFQVALDTDAHEGYVWKLGEVDSAVLKEAGDPAMVLLGTMPSALSQQIFTLEGVAPGAAELTLTNAREGDAEPAATYKVTIDVLAQAAASESDADALGAKLVGTFFDALQSGDKEQVASMLAPAFQLVRSTGERFDAVTYPDNVPVYESYEISDLHATQDGDVVVATYFASTDTTLDGGAPDMGAAAPRLSVFQKIDGEWKLVAHANYAAPAADEAPAAAADAAPPPSTLYVSDMDNGATVRVAAGGALHVKLPGNPSTGYVWQVAANDESILQPNDYQFTADANVPGAGGAEEFDFDVVAPGTVDLKYVYSRPWETEVAPDKTFEVKVEAVADWPVDDLSSYVTLDENGGTTSVLSGSAIKVVLAATDDGGAWKLVSTDPMIVQPLGDWAVVPDGQDATKVTFERAFLGVNSGTTEMQFEYAPADPMADITEKYVVTAVVPPVEPGSSGAVKVTNADAGKDFALVTGDTLVVQLPANYTTGSIWKVVSTNDALLPFAGDEQYALSSDLAGGGGVATFRFLAKGAGEATVQLGEFGPGADTPDQTLDFNATIVDPAPLTGNPTVMVTDADAGKPVELVAGDLFQVSVPGNPSTGYLWMVTQNDGSLLRLQPSSGFTPESDLVGAPGAQVFLFRSLQPGSEKLQIGEFPPGAEEADKTLEYPVRIK